ncbi:MAG: DUF1002 domain-containing protein, partial [Lachnospiraceae bacterium]|nr:DUF1002 domain-containing protein [Lachnospiraceae bacterium]
IRRLGTMFLLCIACVAAMTILVFGSKSRGTAGNKGEETIVGRMIDMVVSGEVDLSDEDDIRRAISEGEAELGITLTQQNRDRIITFMTTLDSIEVGAADFIDQAKQMYQKYSEDIVEEANETINEAVEGAVESAVQNFFESISQSVQDFFRNLTTA